MMQTLSQKALAQAHSVIKAIQAHPFNKQLADGSLPLEKFGYYIEQDTLYLRDYARSLASIASRVPLPYIKDFLRFSEGALIAEQEVVHSFFRKTYGFQETRRLSPATLAYTSYLLQMSLTAPVAVSVAAILPCFWVYNMVGQSISENTEMDSHNPYLKWIEAYSGQEFSDAVARAIIIFDELGASQPENTKALMLNAFYTSTVLEWHFWNDAYNQTVFDSFI
jgi:thiaminase/transcriptional activator TenA